jgi:hypothetical protein
MAVRDRVIESTDDEQALDDLGGTPATSASDAAVRKTAGESGVTVELIDLARLAPTGGRAAGPPPLPAAEPGAALEVDRVVSKDGQVSLGGRYYIAAEILGGMLVSIRIEDSTLMFFDPATRVLLRTRPSPLTWDQARLLRGARPAGPPPRPATDPVTAQRRASNIGVIMIAGQKIALGRIHAGRIVTVHVAERTITIDLGGDDTRTIRRTTTRPVRSIKAHRPREARATHVS